MRDDVAPPAVDQRTHRQPVHTPGIDERYGFSRSSVKETLKKRDNCGSSTKEEYPDGHEIIHPHQQKRAIVGQSHPCFNCVRQTPSTGPASCRSGRGEQDTQFLAQREWAASQARASVRQVRTRERRAEEVSPGTRGRFGVSIIISSHFHHCMASPSDESSRSPVLRHRVPFPHAHHSAL